MEYFTVRMDSRASFFALFCDCHLYFCLPPCRLLQVSRPHNRNSKLLIYGRCQSESWQYTRQLLFFCQKFYMIFNLRISYSMFYVLSDLIQWKFRKNTYVVLWFASILELVWDRCCLCNYYSNQYEVLQTDCDQRIVEFWVFAFCLCASSSIFWKCTRKFILYYTVIFFLPPLHKLCCYFIYSSIFSPFLLDSSWQS